jgi:hypothetical protein
MIGSPAAPMTRAASLPVEYRRVNCRSPAEAPCKPLRSSGNCESKTGSNGKRPETSGFSAGFE